MSIGWKKPGSSFAFLLLMLSSPATASIIDNGGFETGNFTGWTVSGFDAPCSLNDQYCGVSSATDPNFPILVNTGTYAAYFAPVNADTFLSQTLSLAPATSYTLTFSLDEFLPPDPPVYTNSFGVYFDGTAGNTNGTALFTETNAPDSGGYQQFSLQFSTALTGNSDLLQFVFLNDIGYFFIDSVSVTASTPIAPEPAPSALLAIGLAGFAGLVRRNRAASGKPA